MTTDPHPRYVCRHYPRESPPSEFATPPISHVFDSWYGYASVARYVGARSTFIRGFGRLWETAHAQAERRAALWNRDHDAWLAAATGEAAQATKGKGSR